MVGRCQLEFLLRPSTKVAAPVRCPSLWQEGVRVGSVGMCFYWYLVMIKPLKASDKMRSSLEKSVDTENEWILETYEAI
jgi:hypothetical protein